MLEIDERMSDIHRRSRTSHKLKRERELGEGSMNIRTNKRFSSTSGYLGNGQAGIEKTTTS